MADRNLRVLDSLSPVGNALLLHSSRLTVIDAAPAAAVGTKAIKDGTTRVAALVRGAVGGGLEGLKPTAVFCVHLDATNEDQRVKQLSKCLQQARQRGTREIVVAGDFNTELLPGSCAAALVARPDDPAAVSTAAELGAQLAKKECASALRLEAGTSPTAEQLEAWEKLRLAAAGAARDARIEVHRVPTHGTRAAWDHGVSAGPCIDWRLDHVCVSLAALALLGCASAGFHLFFCPVLDVWPPARVLYPHYVTWFDPSPCVLLLFCSPMVMPGRECL